MRAAERLWKCQFRSRECFTHTHTASYIYKRFFFLADSLRPFSFFPSRTFSKLDISTTNLRLATPCIWSSKVLYVGKSFSFASFFLFFFLVKFQRGEGTQRKRKGSKSMYRIYPHPSILYNLIFILYTIYFIFILYHYRLTFFLFLFRVRKLPEISQVSFSKRNDGEVPSRRRYELKFHKPKELGDAKKNPSTFFF